MSKPDHITYWVQLVRVDGVVVEVEISAKTPALAARGAEALSHGSKAREVTIRKFGVCSKCHAVIWEGSTESETRQGRLICGDC